MKVLFDTNVVLDLLLAREPFVNNAAVLFSAVEQGRIDGSLCATTVTTLDYLLTKGIGRERARVALESLFQLFAICPVDRDVLLQALNSDFTDFEDAVIYFSGEKVGVDALLTRNAKDFTAARSNVYSPEQLMEELRSRNEI